MGVRRVRFPSLANGEAGRPVGTSESELGHFVAFIWHVFFLLCPVLLLES